MDIFPITEKEAKKKCIEYSKGNNKNAYFPTILRTLRSKTGISQKELSERMDVSKSTVGLWETGETLPSAIDIYKLSVIFGVSSDYILGLANESAPKMAEGTGLSQKAILTLTKLKKESVVGLNAFLETLSEE